MKEGNILPLEISVAQAQMAATKVKSRNMSVNVLEAAAKEQSGKERFFLGIGRRRYRGRITKLLKELDREERLSSGSEKQGFVKPNYALEPPNKTARVLYEQAQARELYVSVIPQIQAIETEMSQNPSELNLAERILIAGRASTGAARMIPDEREDLLETVGFTKKEAKTVGKRIGFSALLGTITGSLAFAFVNSAAAFEKIHPIVQHITDWKMLLSYGAFYGSTALAALTNKKLLDEPSIKTSANAFPTTGYYLLPKFFSEQKKKVAEKWGVFTGTFLPNIVGELTTWGIIGAFAGLQGVMGRNIGSTIAELATVGGNLSWLHYKRRKGKQTAVEK